MSNPEAVACSYEIDQDLRIVEVDSVWSVFALANEAPELVPPPGPLGKPILSFISDPTSALLYEQVFARVAETGKEIAFPIRCDSPTARRFLDLRIKPRFQVGFLIQTEVRKIEPRSTMLVFERHARRGPRLILMCGWCKLVDVEGQWREIEDALAGLRLFESELPPQITHGICPTCHGQMSRMIGIG